MTNTPATKKENPPQELVFKKDQPLPNGVWNATFISEYVGLSPKAIGDVFKSHNFIDGEGKFTQEAIDLNLGKNFLFSPKEDKFTPYRAYTRAGIEWLIGNLPTSNKEATKKLLDYVLKDKTL